MNKQAGNLDVGDVLLFAPSSGGSAKSAQLAPVHITRVETVEEKGGLFLPITRHPFIAVNDLVMPT